MMKKIFYAISILIASGSVISCEDFLTEPVRGQENLDSYFTTSEEAEKFLFGCYSTVVYNDWWQIYNYWLLTEMCSDDAWMGNTTQDQSTYMSLAHYQGTGQSNTTISNFWQYRYKGILSCNIAIERIPQTTFVDTDYQARLVAEAKFLRAYYYYELVRSFGGVPIIDGFLMPDKIQGIVRESEETVWALVEKDLISASKALPERSELTAAELGRVTRGAALGLLGKAYVYQEKWADAEIVLKEVIDSNEYELLADFGDVWSLDTNNSKESLFETQHMYSESYVLGAHIPTIAGNRSEIWDGWSWCLPTSDLEKAYLDAGDDVRLKWTIIKNGATEIAGEPNQAELFSALAAKGYADGTSYWIDPSMHKSARIWRKFYIPYNSRPAENTKGYLPYNHRVLRYADVLLLYAEACYENINEEAARGALNQVRARVGLAEVTASGTELRDAIRLERRLELAGENNRLFDIRRWKNDAGQPVITDIMGPEGSFVLRNTNQETADPYEWKNQREPSDKGKSFDLNRDLVFPIPLYELQMSNYSIVQNPGWN